MATTERTVLVLQGGGALGAYQAGAYQRLAAAGHHPEWVAGISIGSINGAIICGNPPEKRLERLRAFWTSVTSELALPLVFSGTAARHLYSEAAAASAAVIGVPGFFRPRSPLAFAPFHAEAALSYYDTAPLRDTLMRLVDFDYLNSEGPRLSIGAVNVETGNFAYFDSAEREITPEHVMASGALPPGFPPIEIDGARYWDGGLVSNTPLQYVMEHTGTHALCIFQFDLFSARGQMPGDMAAVAQRQKDIQYSSRTRLTTDRFRHLHRLREAAERLRAKLPEELRDDPDLQMLSGCAPGCSMTLVHLIHRRQAFETQSKDFEFSRLTMTEHWASGEADVAATLAHDDWQRRVPGAWGLHVYDLTGWRPHHTDELEKSA